jgi:hypothetical protein
MTIYKQKKKFSTSALFSIMLLFAFSFLYSGCSSGRKAAEDREDKKEVKIIVAEAIKNIEAEERSIVKKARIKSVDRISFDLQDSKPSNRQRLATLTYNTNGFLTETINYDENGKAESIFTYKYDDKGRRIETIRSTPAGVQQKRYTYEYNEYGNKIRSERYDMLGNLEKYYEYKYDNRGNLTEDIWYDKDGDIEYLIEYDYDSNGRKTKARTFNENNRLINEFEFLYDNEGNLVEELKTDPSGNKTGIIQYVYQHY